MPQKTRKSYASKRQKQSHGAIKILGQTRCKNCHSLKRNHFVCLYCFSYRGRQYSFLNNNS